MKIMKSFDLVNNIVTDIVPSDWGEYRHDPMWIYVLTTNELEREGIVKIGESHNPESRVVQLCNANAGKPALLPNERWFTKYKVLVPESYTGYVNDKGKYKTRISGFDHEVHSYLVKRHGIIRVENHPKYPDNTELFRISPETAHDMICEYFGAEPDNRRVRRPNDVKIVYTPADCVKTMFDRYMFKMRPGCVSPDHKMADNFDLSQRSRKEPFTICTMIVKNAVFINAAIDRFVKCTKGMGKAEIIKRCLADNIYAYCYTENCKNAVKEQIRNHIIYELNIKMDGRIIDELVDNGNIRAIYSMEDSRKEMESKIADCIGGRRFDAVVMNPPYDSGLHLKFLRKALEISDQYVLTIQPAAWLVGCQTSNDDTKAIVKAADMYHTVVDSVHGTTMFNNDAMIAGEITIDFFDKKDPDRCLMFNGNRYDRCADVDLYKHSDKYVNFIKFIDELVQKNGSVESHILRSPNAKSKIFSKNCIDYDNTDSPVIRMTGFAGDKKIRSKSNGDFWTLGLGKGDGKSAKSVICRNISEFNKTDKNEDRLDVYIRFYDKLNRDNCYNYFKTDFARICVKRKKHNEHLDAGPLRYVPFFDFSDKRFSGSPTDIDNVIFSMYTDWCVQHLIEPDTDIVRYYIEDELPDFYKIRK